MSKIITQQTIFFENDGQLECFRETGPSFHKLSTHRAAKFSLRVPETVSLQINVSEMAILDNNQQKYFNMVNDLKNFHDTEYYNIGGFDVSDDSIAIYLVLSVFLILLIALFAMHSRIRNILHKIPTSVIRNLK